MKPIPTDLAWLELDSIPENLTNPFTTYPHDVVGVSLLRIMRDPRYFGFTCQHLLNIKLLPMQIVILQQMWNTSFPMLIGTRGLGKTFLLGVYAVLKCILIPETKVVIVGGAFRQSKFVFEYAVGIWNNAPVLRSICRDGDGPRIETDRCTMRINGSTIIAVPLGTGQKIRGLRAHTILTDEFDSVPPNIYERVIAGFTSVTADPVANVQAAAQRRVMMKSGEWNESLEELYLEKSRGNQSIISGSAGYDFEHFAAYWRQYKAIIETKGNIKALEKIFGDNEEIIHKTFSWKDYCIMRVPYNLMPPGFMDEKQILRAKATMHIGLFGMEYGAAFAKDSEGFFKRSLVESCVASETKPVVLPSGAVWFNARTFGDPKLQYVFGVDPASEEDNFSIVILELHPTHTRVVLTWTINRDRFKARVKAGLVKENDYYHYCSRKIRDLMAVFPCVCIGVDAQGGGRAIEEALHDNDKLKTGEVNIWPVINDEKSEDTDDKSGLHILELIQFADSKWTAGANHGLRKDLEDRALLFPQFDPITLELSLAQDKMAIEAGNDSRRYDSLEDCVMEIEELKTELSTIVMTRTSTSAGARDRWSTPEVKIDGGKKGRLRKDRYSALVIANMIARTIHRADARPSYEVIGGASHLIAKGKKGKYYQGPEWYSAFDANLCQGIFRG